MEDYVSFELAAKLNEKGYPQYHSAFRSYFIGDDVPRIAEIGDVIYRTKIEGEEHLIACPTISQVLKWLREEKGLYVDISLYKKGHCTLIYETNFPDGKDYANSWRVNNTYNTYEQAAIAGIEYVVNNLI